MNPSQVLPPGAPVGGSFYFKDEQAALNALLDTFVELGSSSHVYMGDRIPAHMTKVANARMGARVPAQDTVWLVIDNTTLGTAEICIVLTNSGLYFHNPSGTHIHGAINWFEFPTLPISVKGSHVVIGSFNVYVHHHTTHTADVMKRFQLVLPPLLRAQAAATSREQMLQQVIIQYFEAQPHLGWVYVKNIPPSKSQMAAAKCVLPGAEPPLVLFDETRTGSADNCVVVTSGGIYWHLPGCDPHRGTIGWKEFVTQNLRADDHCIFFGHKIVKPAHHNSSHYFQIFQPLRDKLIAADLF